MTPSVRVPRTTWRDGAFSAGERVVPEETAVALAYDGGTYAVMMATPQNLEDFAVGFSLAEGIIAAPSDIHSFEAVPHDEGMELRMWLAAGNAARLSERRRHIAGPTGCGLCGIDSLTEAMRPAAVVGAGVTITPHEIMAAMQRLPALQVLNTETRAVHGAAFWTRARGIIALREDVGRHNALDKLGGALARGKIAATRGVVLLTSRISVEMVQKTAAMGASVMVSVSAPTALAIRMAERANITLCAVARTDGFEVFTHAGRISRAEQTDVA